MIGDMVCAWVCVRGVCVCWGHEGDTRDTHLNGSQ